MQRRLSIAPDRQHTPPNFVGVLQKRELHARLRRHAAAGISGAALCKTTYAFEIAHFLTCSEAALLLQRYVVQATSCIIEDGGTQFFIASQQTTIGVCC